MKKNITSEQTFLQQFEKIIWNKASWYRVTERAVELYDSDKPYELCILWDDSESTITNREDIIEAIEEYHQQIGIFDKELDPKIIDNEQYFQ